MDLEIQWFWLGHEKTCVSAIVRGPLVVGDFKETLRRIAEVFVSFAGPLVLDLRDARWNFGGGDFPGIVAAFAEAGLGIDHKVALVCARDIEAFGDVVYIASGASNRGLKMRAFYDFDGAIKWLAEELNFC